MVCALSGPVPMTRTSAVSGPCEVYPTRAPLGGGLPLAQRQTAYTVPDASLVFGGG
jgi:hypothetical protein